MKREQKSEFLSSRVRYIPINTIQPNPQQPRRRFDEALTKYLLKLRWWDWDAKKIFRNMDALCSGDLEKIKHIRD